MHRHARPFLIAVGLLVLASAAWWMWPDPALTPADPLDEPGEIRSPPDPRPGPTFAGQPDARVGKEQLRAPSEPPDAELHLPGALPKLDAAIAPALPDPEPPIETLEVVGQLHPSAGQNPARAAWPAVQRCAGDWRGDLQLSFGVAGGEIPGDSRFWEPKVSGAPQAIAACILAELADLRTAAATDASGAVTAVYHLGERP